MPVHKKFSRDRGGHRLPPGTQLNVRQIFRRPNADVYKKGFFLATVPSFSWPPPCRSLNSVQLPAVKVQVFAMLLQSVGTAKASSPIASSRRPRPFNGSNLHDNPSASVFSFKLLKSIVRDVNSLFNRHSTNVAVELIFIFDYSAIEASKLFPYPAEILSTITSSIKSHSYLIWS
jgi:hypothetical protein